MSRHVLFALGVDPTARDAGEGGGFRPSLVSYALRSVKRDNSNNTTDVRYEGEIVRVAPQKLATCSAYRYTYVDRS